jgi:flavin-dependent dehydrogenase
MLEDRYDVVIVGSGPAGAAAAQAMRGHGLNSVMIERGKLPRYKMCSGIVFPRARKLVADDFGPLPKDVIAEPAVVHGNRLFLDLEDPAITAPFSVFDDDPDLGEEALSVKRSEFDHWLSCQSGIPIVDGCLFSELRRDGEDLVVELSRDGDEVEVRTRYLVGADGTQSAVRGEVSRSFEQGVRLIPNYEEWYTGNIDLEPGWFYQFFDRTITGFFATVFHKDGHIIVVTGARQEEPVRDYFQRFVAHLEQRHGLVIDARVRQSGCGVHDMAATGNYFLGEGNVLLAGEAGGFNRCAEGITSALVTGRSAGESIVRSFDSGGSALAAYSDAVAAEIDACAKVYQVIEEAMGFNPFTRG